jgi:pseudaminic acid synthase
MTAQMIQLGPYLLGRTSPPLIVAELSGNHQHSLHRVLELVETAKDCGVQAIKLQTYTPDTITLQVNREEFFIHNSNSLWKGRHLYELYEEAHLPWEWHQPIFAHCQALGLLCFSTPFDETAVDFLEELQTPCYKIASPEIVDHGLIQRVSSTGKPVILSTGAATLLEIAEAVSVARHAGCQDLILLKCTAAYPALPQDAHLRTIPHLAETFGALVGLSDHTLGIGVAIASVALGACIIEKHFTLSRNERGVDSAFSMEPLEMTLLVEETRRAWEGLGSIHYAPLVSEFVAHSHRPSLYFVEDIERGVTITAHHIRSVRPGNGLHPKELPHLIGLKLMQNVNKGTAVSWDVFKCE